MFYKDSKSSLDTLDLVLWCERQKKSTGDGSQRPEPSPVDTGSQKNNRP